MNILNYNTQADILNVLNLIKDSLFDQSVAENSLTELSVKYAKYSEFFTAEDDGRVVGCVAMYCNNINSKNAFISMIVVDKAFQHCGIGTLLFNHAKDIALKNNMKILKLEVSKQNSSAISFYIRLGMTIDEEKNESYILKLPLAKKNGLLIR